MKKRPCHHGKKSPANHLEKSYICTFILIITEKKYLITSDLYDVPVVSFSLVLICNFSIAFLISLHDFLIPTAGGESECVLHFPTLPGVKLDPFLLNVNILILGIRM